MRARARACAGINVVARGQRESAALRRDEDASCVLTQTRRRVHLVPVVCLVRVE